MEATIAFVHSEGNRTTSFMVDDVEMSMWIDAQPPTWAKKLIEIIRQRQSLPVLSWESAS